jgi:hypothetical protein
VKRQLFLIAMAVSDDHHPYVDKRLERLKSSVITSDEDLILER